MEGSKGENMDPLKFLVDLVPSRYRKYAIYGPAALVILVSAGVLGFDAASADFNLDAAGLWLVASANTFASGALALANKNTDVPVESE